MSDILQETITLPGGSTAVVREMLGSEEDILSNEKHRKSGRTIDLLLSNVILELNGQKATEQLVQDLYTGDRYYALLKTRILSEGSTLEGSVECPNEECRAEVPIHVDLDEIEVTSPDGVPETTVNVLGTSVLLRATKGRDELKMFQSRHKGDLATTALMVRIKDIEGLSVAQYRGWLLKLPSRERRRLRDTANELEFGPKMSVEAHCEACDTEWTQDLISVPDFLYPGGGRDQE